MSDKYIKEITQNIPNNELNAAYDALMNSSLNETSDYEEVSMEELNEYIEGLECQAEDLRTQLAKANERVKELEQINLELAANVEACCELTEMDMGAAIDRLFEIDNTESKALLNKFAIEKVADGFERYATICEAFCTNPTPDTLREHAKQLRKEQDSE